MNKIAFTPEGIQDLLAQIYQLPREDQLQHADAMVANFRLWMLSHFDLNMEQAAYLNGLSLSSTRYLAAVCSICLENNASVNFIKKRPGYPASKRGLKTIKSSNTVLITSRSPELNEASCVILSFEIFYQN